MVLKFLYDNLLDIRFLITGLSVMNTVYIAGLMMKINRIKNNIMYIRQ